MSEKVNARDAVGKSICKLSATTRKGQYTHSEVVAKIALLNNHWKRFCEHHDCVLAVCGKETIEAQYAIYDPIEDAYVETLARLEGVRAEFVRELTALAAQSTAAAAPAAPLAVAPPSISMIQKPCVPQFSGGYIDFQSWQEIYKVSVHNERRLSAVEKFQLLRTIVIGEAAQLICHIAITAENYELAWQTLQNRYTNVRIVTNSLVARIVTQPQASETVNGIKSLLDTTSQSMLLLRNLNRPTENWDDLIVYLIGSKLPTESRRLWDTKIAATDMPTTWNTLEAFLQTRFRTLEASTENDAAHQPAIRAKVIKTQAKANHSRFDSRQKSKIQCPLCNEGHQIYRCSMFNSQTVEQRRESAAKANVCFNCLYPNHTVSSCPSTRRCRHCSGAHHSMLHLIAAKHQATPVPSTGVVATAIQSSNVAVSMQTVLLATAQVRATSSKGIQHTLRVLLDQGSHISLITEQAAQRLCLSRRRSNVDIVPVGQGAPITPNGCAHISLLSIHDNLQQAVDATVFVIPSITAALPSNAMLIECNIDWPHPLADPNWHQPMPIDVLLGADVYHDIIQPGVRKLNRNSLLAQNTTFGWVLSGKTCQLESSQCQNQPVYHCSHITVANESIDKLLRQFWELADPQDDQHASSEAQFVERHYEETHRRMSSGRYEVRLPFRSLMTGIPESLGDSLPAAIKRLEQVERRLKFNSELRKQYVEFMDQYIKLGHMQLIPPPEVANFADGVFYLPHHPVIKPSSTSTKVRVVFDGSRKTMAGNSLNETLLIGPTLQADLLTILMRWRNHKFAFCADVKQMYRQIMIHCDDRDYQRIVWRASPDDPISHYKLCTVTYGTSSAPFLAVKTLRQLAIDEQVTYPLASKATLTDFYVDDIMSGANDVATVLQLQSELLNLMHAGGMELLKWSSNRNEVLASLPESSRQCTFPLSINCNDTISTLGIVWDPALDSLGFKIQPSELNSSKNLSKRMLLSAASKLFDPVGWLAPVTLVPKLMFQKLWLLKLDWDDSVPGSMTREWDSYQSSLQHLSTIKISRWTGYAPTDKSYQIHGFSDASTVAYAAVVYLRATGSDSVTTVSIITAKSRVAPIKTISLPRLELCGAVLLADLMKYVLQAMFPTINVDIFAWCDSQITLAWLQSPPSRWKVFIANRTSQIISKLPNCRFGYVKSADNPADVASRGICPSKLPNHHLWWTGPPWLSLPPSDWPTKSKNDADPDTIVEQRAVCQFTDLSANHPHELIERYSSLSKLLRIASYCRRFCANLRTSPESRKTNGIDTTELNAALQSLVVHVQQQSFATDVRQLNEGAHVSKKSPLISLNPFIDTNAVLRVGGRLRRADLPFNQKHPMILPRQGTLTKLIVRYAHATTLHGNVQIMLNFIRLSYWIIGARAAVKECIHECTICRRLSVKPSAPFMADLPASRVTQSFPFLHTAIDYAGPTTIRVLRGRGRRLTMKGYISVFVCLSTKAIHLEAVTELTSEAFLAAFRRFISRRGKCSDVYTDNGTNFVGANRVLNEYRNIAIRASPHLASEQIQWHFSPASAPHFNGLAESGVKAMKRHLNRVVGNAVLTYEELSTVLCQIEACLNSRPLCALRDDPTQDTVLTPGHFIIGRPPLMPSEPNVLSHRTLPNRWHLIQQIVQGYWKQWHIEYLVELQQRHKWTQPRPEPKVNDLVLIKEDNLPPLRWAIGRIIKLHPGNDKVTRVVTLKTASNDNLVRPIVKLCWLPQQTK